MRLLILGLDPERDADHRGALGGLAELLARIEPELAVSAVHGSAEDVCAAEAIETDPSEVVAAIRASDLIFWRPDLKLPESAGEAVGVARVAHALRTCPAYTLAYLRDWPPPRSRRETLQARTALALADGIAYTNPDTGDWLRLKLGLPCTHLPDPSFMLRSVPHDQLTLRMASLAVPDDGRGLLGVDLRPLKLTPRTEENTILMQRYPALIAQTLNDTATRTDTEIVLLSASPDAKHLSLHASLREELSVRVYPVHVADPAMYKGMATRMQTLLTDRPTPAMLAASVGRPVVGVGAYGRLNGTLQTLGRPHDQLDPELFARGGLAVQLGELLQTAIRLGRAPAERIEEIKAEARSAYRRLIEDIASDR